MLCPTDREDEVRQEPSKEHSWMMMPRDSQPSDGLGVRRIGGTSRREWAGGDSTLSAHARTALCTDTRHPPASI